MAQARIMGRLPRKTNKHSPQISCRVSFESVHSVAAPLLHDPVNRCKSSGERPYRSTLPEKLLHEFHAPVRLNLPRVHHRAMAAHYPTKPMRIVVAYAPARTTDILARTIGQKVTEAWAQPVIIANRPGANGSIGTEYAAKSALLLL
jgi:hypothetical protein